MYIYIYMYTYICVYIYIYIHTHTHTHAVEYYSAIKNDILPFLPFLTTCMDLEGIMRSEISQTEKGKYCIISLICGN